MTDPLSILLLHGDAEARLLAGAGDALRLSFSHRDLSWHTAWMPRPAQLTIDAPPVPDELRQRGLLPEVDARALLQRRHDLVIVSLFPAVAQPSLRHPAGGSILVHRGLREGWSPSQAALAAECVEEPPLSPSMAAQELAPIIEGLQDRGTNVALCTTFRHVPAPLEHRRIDGSASLRDLVRASNLEVARLSQRTGCFVLDLDRPLAQEGGASLGADCFGGDERAAELALEELIGLVFDVLPEAAFPPEAA